MSPALLTVEEAKGSARTTGPATIGDDVDIAARNEEVACSGFDEAGRRAEVLDLPRIGGRGNETGYRRRSAGPVHVCHKRYAIAHGHGTSCPDHGVGRRREL